MTPHGQHLSAGGDANKSAPAGSTTVVAGRNHLGDVREAGAQVSSFRRLMALESRT
jgi:hypothetical protein